MDQRRSGSRMWLSPSGSALALGTQFHWKAHHLYPAGCGTLAVNWLGQPSHRQACRPRLGYGEARRAYARFHLALGIPRIAAVLRPSFSLPTTLAPHRRPFPTFYASLLNWRYNMPLPHGRIHDAKNYLGLDFWPDHLLHCAASYHRIVWIINQ